MNECVIHLVSDATGETVANLSRACLAQFDGSDFVRHNWPMVRTAEALDEVLRAVEAEPGLVLCTIVDPQLQDRLIAHCKRLRVPCIPILDPIINAISSLVGVEARNMPGRQHTMDSDYFNRIDAINFVLTHDDGQSAWNLNDADIIILGVSRTAKTPICFYLANRGIRAANVPVVPGCPLPEELENLDHPLVVGLTRDPHTLIQIRKNRLRMLDQAQDTDYVDLDAVSDELRGAKRLFSKFGWPVIDVTRKSIEETASTILLLHKTHQGSRS